MFQIRYIYGQKRIFGCLACETMIVPPSWYAVTPGVDKGNMGGSINSDTETGQNKSSSKDNQGSTWGCICRSIGQLCSLCYLCYIMCLKCTRQEPRYEPVPTNENFQDESLKPLSAGTLENVRYRLGEPPHAEHVNEDRWFDARGGRCQVMALFDGHDGPRAVDHVLKYVSKQVKKRKKSEMILTTLQDMFLETENHFFSNISAAVEEKQRLEAVIPPVSATV